MSILVHRDTRIELWRGHYYRMKVFVIILRRKDIVSLEADLDLLVRGVDTEHPRLNCSSHLADDETVNLSRLH